MSKIIKMKMFNRKNAQAALEYLHTYGWVILTMLVLGGVMVNYNISNATSFLPIDCAFLSGIDCLDSSVDETLLYLELVNGFGFAMGNITMNITGTCNSTANTTDGNVYGNPKVLLENQQSTYIFECQNLSNMRVSEHISIGYRNVESGQFHVKVGMLEYSPTAS